MPGKCGFDRLFRGRRGCNRLIDFGYKKHYCGDNQVKARVATGSESLIIRVKSGYSENENLKYFENEPLYYLEITEDLLSEKTFL
jgi:hypothetical protein